MIGVAVNKQFLVGVLIGAGGFWAWNRWIKNVPSTK